MTDPNPTFLSLVDHGANQSPFRALKADDSLPAVGLGGTPSTTSTQPPAPMKITPPAGTEKKTDGTPQGEVTLVSLSENNGVVISEGVEIHRIEFARAQFGEAELASKFLTDAGYTSFEVVPETKADAPAAFFVEGIDESSFEKVEKIELPNGVTFHVGKLKAAPEQKTDTPPGGDPPAPALDEAAIAPLRALVSKFDGWSPTSATTLAQVVSDMSLDGIPLGYWSLQDAFSKALANIIRTGQLPLIAPLCAEFASALTTLATLFASLVKSDATGAESLLQLTAPSAPASQEPVQKSDNPAPVAGMTQAEVEALVTARVTELLTKMDLLSTELRNELVAKSDLATEVTPLRESVAKHDLRLARVERVRQVRKSDTPAAGGPPSSGPSGEGTTAPPAPAAPTQERVTRSEANALGISQVSRPRIARP